MRAGQRVRRAIAGLVLVGAPLLAAACGTTPGTSSDSGLLSGTMGGNSVAPLKTVRTLTAGPVLASGTGYTLYWFSADTATSSACASVCVPQWPPVTGAPRPAKGVTLKGRLGTIIRSDGTVQATYDGHPLYTFAGDFEPGDVGGNNVAQFGGTWHAIRVPAS
jgi:predicted lipoprotein with Yx(FWY)xxD motif